MTDPAPTVPDPVAILEGLSAAKVRFILVGGLAAVAQGAPITTMDVDIVPDRSPENLSRLMAFLQSIDAVYRRPDDKVIRPRKEDIAGSGHCLLRTRMGSLDVLGAIERRMAYEDLVERSVMIPFKGYSIQVLNLETLLELKRLSRDPKDKQRLPVLEETLRQSTLPKKDR